MLRTSLLLTLFFALGVPAAGQPVPFERAYSQGLSLLQQGDADAAIPHLQMAYAADSLRPGVYTALAAAFLQTQQAPRAEKLARKGIQQFDQPGQSGSPTPETSSRLIHLRQLYAEALLHQKNFEPALEAYEVVEDAMERGTPVPGLRLEDLRIRLGELYQIVGSRAFEAEQYAKARGYYEKAVEYAPGEPAVHRNLSYLYLQQGDAAAMLEAAATGLQHFPDDRELLRLKATALTQLERYDDAVPVYAELYARSPDDVDLGLAYAQVLLMAQQRLKALEHFEDLLQRHPKERRIYEALIELNRRALNFQGALKVLYRLRSQYPDDADVLRRIAEAHELIEEYDDAAAVYDTLAALSGRPEDAVQARGRLLQRQDSLAAALDLYQEQLAQHPTDTTLLRSTADVLYEMQRWDEALPHYRDLARATDSPAALYSAAYALEQLGRPREAAAAYQDAIDEGATDPLPYYRVSVLLESSIPVSSILDASILDLRSSTPPCALAQRGLRLGLQRVQSLQRTLSTLLQNRGTGSMADLPDLETDLERQNRLAEELVEWVPNVCSSSETAALLDELLAEYPASARLQYLVGRHLQQHGDTIEARRRLQEAARLTPTLLEAHLALGDLHAAEGNVREAILAYERVLSLDDEHAEAYRALIRLHREAGRLDALIRRWQARHRTSAENPVLREHLIEALHKAGRAEEARKLIEQASER